MTSARFDDYRIVFDLVNQAICVVNASAVTCAVFQAFRLAETAQNSVALNALQQSIDFVERF